MVYYTHFARDTPSDERKKLWNPAETLEIFNTDFGYEGSLTCVGDAPSQRRRCRNPIRADNRQLIMRTLEDIAYLDPHSPTVMSRLRAIAGPALCVRNHQGQARSILMDWQNNIQQLKPQIGERTRGTTTRVQSIKKENDDSMEELRAQLREMKELLAKMQQDREGYESREESAAKNRREEERERRREARRVEKERLEKEGLEEERLEKERLEEARLEKERVEKERLAKERLDKERKEREEKERLEGERAAQNERIRERAQKRRENAEREKRERERKEREEWDQLWTKYQERWEQFRSPAPREGNIRDAIPWPVKSASYSDVNASNVKEFLEKAMPKDANVAQLRKKECLKWHSDRFPRLLRGSHLPDVEQMMVNMIIRVVTDLINESARRSSDCID